MIKFFCRPSAVVRGPPFGDCWLMIVIFYVTRVSYTFIYLSKNPYNSILKGGNSLIMNTKSRCKRWCWHRQVIYNDRVVYIIRIVYFRISEQKFNEYATAVNIFSFYKQRKIMIRYIGGYTHSESFWLFDKNVKTRKCSRFLARPNTPPP